ncbi:hypothetical protein BofuT4_uP075210.1 [Botrytis cinerea T4]|uniref:Uncharacterized protein n=1 Tax=Botryotinia fuckeliana (strain T4) TaxID=999810 RepID=G2XNI2_BOTF4|nr:hypothetical protein BofuT4_uP075210.1 [Botrytis cinerea T4]
MHKAQGTRHKAQSTIKRYGHRTQADALRKAILSEHSSISIRSSCSETPVESLGH